MRSEVLDRLRCPGCGSPFSAPDSGDSAFLRCATGHEYPVVDGIPRLLLRDGHDDRVQESFSREWRNHRLGDRTWYTDLSVRVQSVFLEPLRIPPEQLGDLVVLDAGCGNGSQSVAYTDHVAEVIALDVSSGVELGQAFRAAWPGNRAEHVQFLQADLQHPPLAPGSVDAIHCAGVLHHTPDTRASFRALVPLLAPGGTMYVWVYRHEPLLTPLLRVLRAGTTRIPIPVFDRLTKLLALPFVAFTRVADASGLRAYPRISRREATLALMDIFAAPFAHHHSIPEVEGWFRAEGFTEVWTANEGRRGFGVCGRLPPQDAVDH